MRALPLLLLLAPSALAQEAPPRRIALVIGVSSYPYLPPELSLDTARTEAARVAAALEQGAGFDEVRLLTDASATSTNVMSVLREDVARDVQWRDLFLLYFVGHGLGADFGDPRLLFYDTRPDAVEATSLTTRELATILQQQIRASRYVVATDAAFPGSLNGVALLGPTGSDWPALGSESFAVSSAAPRQHAAPGVFSRAFVDGVSGRADTNADFTEIGSELNAWLVIAVPNATGGAQLPTVQGAYAPGIEIARRGAVAAPPSAGTKVDKAKFVFQGGTNPEVLCGAGQPPVSCDPSCYLWDLAPGPCTVRMVVGNATLEGSANVAYRGAYTCGPFEGALRCSSPPPPQ